MNAAERQQAQRLAQRHQAYLDRLQAERVARAQAEQHEREARDAKLAESREQKRRERQAEATRARQFAEERVQRLVQARTKRVREQQAALREARPYPEPSGPRAAADAPHAESRLPARARRREPRLTPLVIRVHPPARRVYRLAKLSLQTASVKLQPRRVKRPAAPAKDRTRTVRVQAPQERLAPKRQAQRMSLLSRARPIGRRVYKIVRHAVAPRPALQRPAAGAAKPRIVRKLVAARVYKIARSAAAPKSAVQRRAAAGPRPARPRIAARLAAQRPAMTKPALQRERPQAQSPAHRPPAASSSTVRDSRRLNAKAKPAPRRSPVAEPAAVRQLHGLAKPSAVAAAAAGQPATPATTPAAVQPSAELPDTLLWLRTQDGFVVDEMGTAISLRGVTVAGLDTAAPADGQTLAEALSLDDAGLSTIIDLWGAQVVRVPFYAQTILDGNDALSGGDVLAGLDDLVSRVADAGAYVLLVQQPAAGLTLPDADVFQSWRSLAARYADEPAVLFEPFAADAPLDDSWPDVALMLAGVIRKEHPASLLFLGNGSAGPGVTGLPLRFSTDDPVPNVVYTLRVDPQHPPNGRDARLAGLADGFPLVASQWSNGGTDLDRSSELAGALFTRYGIGAVAGNWNAPPRLVVDAAARNFAPTAWGQTVLRFMSAPAKPQYVRLLSG